MVHVISLECSQGPANGYYPEPYESVNILETVAKIIEVFKSFYTNWSVQNVFKLPFQQAVSLVSGTVIVSPWQNTQGTYSTKFPYCYKNKDISCLRCKEKRGVRGSKNAKKIKYSSCVFLWKLRTLSNMRNGWHNPQRSIKVINTIKIQA
jgi:hypothetical protein